MHCRPSFPSADCILDFLRLFARDSKSTVWFKLIKIVISIIWKILATIENIEYHSSSLNVRDCRVLIFSQRDLFSYLKTSQGHFRIVLP